MNDTRTPLDALIRRAHETPERLAFGFQRQMLSYAELLAGARSMAAGLVDRGLGPGERCVLSLGTSPALLFGFFGVQLAGGIPVIVDHRAPVHRLDRRASLVGSRFIVRADPLVGESPGEQRALSAEVLAVDALMHATPGRTPDLPGPTDVSHLQFTSGTSGEPRAAILTHRNMMCMIALTKTELGLREREVYVSWLPLYHDFGLVRFVATPVVLGHPCHLLAPSLASLGRWLATIGRVGGTVTGCPDFGYRIATRVVRPDTVDLSTLRYATCGGEPVRSSTMDAFAERFGLAQGVMLPGYGLAEATLTVTCATPGEPVVSDSEGHVSCGTPMPGLKVSVGADPSHPAPVGHSGRIWVRGETVFAGYWDAPEATAAVMRDGWLDTGDVGRFDDRGRLFVLARERAMIKRAGSAIAPREIEEAVDRLGAVRFSAAIGVPNQGLGGTEDVVVVAEVRPAAVSDPPSRIRVAAEVRAAAEGALGYAPGRVVLVGPRSIPRTDNGKVRHAALRKKWLKGSLDSDVVHAT